MPYVIATYGTCPTRDGRISTSKNYLQQAEITPTGAVGFLCLTPAILQAERYETRREAQMIADAIIHNGEGYAAWPPGWLARLRVLCPRASGRTVLRVQRA